MARGVMFHFGTKSAIGNYSEIDESDFYEQLDSLGVDYVKNQDSEDAKNSIWCLVSRLWAAGFKVKLSADPDYEGFYFFDTGSVAELTACKSKYFANAFASLQEKVSRMSLETFATDNSVAYDLRHLITDTANDAVSFGEYLEATYSLDHFIRSILQPDTGYYIAPETVFLH